jgi:carboxyl-terminal processing protease
VSRLVQEQFWDARFNGVDWVQVEKQYRPRALAAADHEEFAAIVNQMLGELRTSHTCYFTKWDPDYYTLQATILSQALADYGTSDPAEVEKREPGHYSAQGRPHRTGIGMVTMRIGADHFVSRVLYDSEAQKAGLLLGDRLIEVDGQPFHPIRSFEGKAGRPVELVLQRRADASSRLTVQVTPGVHEEKQLFEDDAEAQTRILEHQGHRCAYMPLCWLSGWRMRSVLARGFGLACESQGLIIDLRHGFGGSPPIEYLDPFLRTGLQEVTVEMTMRGRRLTSKVAFDGPVIVLINGNSRSGKELLAYYFRKTGRGILLGERTAGFVSGGRTRRVSDESLLYYCVGMITIDGKRLEGVGVEPDIRVPFDIRFAAGRDVQLERAKQKMVRLIEAMPPAPTTPAK